MLIFKILLTLVVAFVVVLPIHLVTEERYQWLDRALWAIVYIMFGIVAILAACGLFVLWTEF